jgi:ribosomal protein S18 acetylase RimI-like enzyme
VVELVPVALSDRALVERFIRVPFWIYREHHPMPQWVPPLLMDRRDYLDEKKNPFYEHAECRFWIARKDGRDVGRIAAVHDADWEKFHGDKVGYFGMFESPDDPEVAGALVDAALGFLRERGRTSVLGPFDLSTNYVAGLLIEGFDSDPNMQMSYNPPYYAKLLESQGFSKTKDLWQWWLSTETEIPEKVVRVSEKIGQRHHVSIRKMDLGNWDAEVTRVLSIYNDAWEKNWGFVPVGEKEFRHIAKDLKMVLDENLAFMGEVDGEPVAFGITVLNINPILKKLDGKLFPFGIFRLLWDFKVKKAYDDCRLIVLGIKSGYRRRGIDSLFFVETHKAARRLGLRGGEIGWTLDDNEMVNRAIESMSGKKVKTYRVYGRGL